MKTKSAKRIAHPVEAAGVIFDPECCDGFAYVGDGPALIAAGLVRRDWLPSNPGCPNKIAFTTRVDDRRVNVRRKSGGKFLVCFSLTGAEWDARDRRQEVDRGAECIAKFEAALPASRESFRTLVMAQFCSTFVSIKEQRAVYVNADWRREFVDGSGGYELPAATLDQLCDLMREGVEILRDSPITFDAGRRQREIAAIRLPLAKKDEAFQALLSKTTAIQNG